MAAHTGNDIDVNFLQQILLYNNSKYLLWDGYKPDGTKKQSWVKGAVDLELHVKGIKKQGGLLIEDGKSKNIVIDIDGEIPADKIAAAAFKIDTKLIPFKSPSGRKWHIWKFLPDAVPAKEVHAEAKKIEKEFVKVYGKIVDIGKTQPSLNGFTGINFPFCTDAQYPYSPAGHKLTFQQFKYRLKFQDHPILAMAAGLQHPRHDALILMAAYLYKKDMMQHLDEVAAAMDNFDDESYLDRIKNKKIHEKYDVGTNAINKLISTILMDDYKLPEADAEVTEELDITEHTGVERIKKRPWLVHGWLLENALTLVVGQPGVGKTMLLHMMAYALATGNLIFGKQVEKRGNVLIVAAEETQNEMDIRLAACKQQMGKNDGKFKIYKRGLEQDLKLVNFSKEKAYQTKQYKQLENTIKNKNIKYIILDPLINFQTGSYDENSNQNMDAYIKNFLIPFITIFKRDKIIGNIQIVSIMR